MAAKALTPLKGVFFSMPLDGTEKSPAKSTGTMESPRCGVLDVLMN